MEKHELALDIPDTLTKCIFRVVDSSIYGDMVPVDCTKIEITPPGFTTTYRKSRNWISCKFECL